MDQQLAFPFATITNLPAIITRVEWRREAWYEYEHDVLVARIQEFRCGKVKSDKVHTMKRRGAKYKYTYRAQRWTSVRFIPVGMFIEEK